MRHIPKRGERMEALLLSIRDMKAGRVTPVEDMLAELRRILAEPRRLIEP